MQFVCFCFGRKDRSRNHERIDLGLVRAPEWLSAHELAHYCTCTSTSNKTVLQLSNRKYSIKILQNLFLLTKAKDSNEAYCLTLSMHINETFQG
jgi:hypothetical protein